MNPIEPRAGACMEYSDGYLFIAGGHNDDGIYSDMFMVNVQNGHVKQLQLNGPSLQLTHANMTRAVMGDGLFLYGGFNGSSWNQCLYEYDIRMEIRSHYLHVF